MKKLLSLSLAALLIAQQTSIMAMQKQEPNKQTFFGNIWQGVGYLFTKTTGMSATNQALTSIPCEEISQWHNAYFNNTEDLNDCATGNFFTYSQIVRGDIKSPQKGIIHVVDYHAQKEIFKISGVTDHQFSTDGNILAYRNHQGIYHFFNCVGCTKSSTVPDCFELEHGILRAKDSKFHNNDNDWDRVKEHVKQRGQETTIHYQISADERFLAYEEGNTLRLFDFTKQEEILTVPMQSHYDAAFKLSPKGTHLAYINNGALHLFDCIHKETTCITRKIASFISVLESIAKPFNHNGNLIAYMDDKDLCHLFDVQNKHEVYPIDAYGNQIVLMGEPAFIGHEGYLLTWKWDFTLTLYKLDGLAVNPAPQSQTLDDSVINEEKKIDG